MHWIIQIFSFTSFLKDYAFILMSCSDFHLCSIFCLSRTKSIICLKSESKRCCSVFWKDACCHVAHTGGEGLSRTWVITFWFTAAKVTHACSCVKLWKLVNEELALSFIAFSPGWKVYALDLMVNLRQQQSSEYLIFKSFSPVWF